MRFEINEQTAFDGTHKLAEVTKPKSDPDDPSPDLTIEVAARLARDEHPRTKWADMNYEKQGMYFSNARFIIVNIRRFDWANDYARLGGK